MTKLFIDFLKDNNALTAFNVNLSMAKDHKPFYTHLVKCQPPSTWVLFAFVWVSTSEGFEYWSDLDDKWAEIIYKNHKDETT